MPELWFSKTLCKDYVYADSERLIENGYEYKIHRPTCGCLLEDGTVCGKPAHDTTGGINPKWRKRKGIGYVCAKHYHYFKPSRKKGAELSFG